MRGMRSRNICGIEAWMHWHKSAAAFLDLPATHILFRGMALGRA
jgi:hypothetical protein